MAWPGNDLKIRDKCRIYWLYFLKNKIDFKSVTVYMQGELSSISCCFYLLIQQHSKKKKQPCKSYPAVASMLTKEQLLAEQPGNSARGTPGASASVSDLSKWTLPCQTTSVSVPHFLFCYLSSLGVEERILCSRMVAVQALISECLFWLILSRLFLLKLDWPAVGSTWSWNSLFHTST